MKSNVSPHGLLQPAVAFGQAACCEPACNGALDSRLSQEKRQQAAAVQGNETITKI